MMNDNECRLRVCMPIQALVVSERRLSRLCWRLDERADSWRRHIPRTSAQWNQCAGCRSTLQQFLSDPNRDIRVRSTNALRKIDRWRWRRIARNKERCNPFRVEGFCGWFTQGSSFRRNPGLSDGIPLGYSGRGFVELRKSIYAC